MLSRHLKVFLNHTVATVLARLERTVVPSAFRDPSDVAFKGISIYRADPTGTTGLAASPHCQRRRDPAAARSAPAGIVTRVAVP